MPLTGKEVPVDDWFYNESVSAIRLTKMILIRDSRIRDNH